MAAPDSDRAGIDEQTFEHPLLRGYLPYRDFLANPAWPTPDALTAALDRGDDERTLRVRFAAQTPLLVADGLHYEQRIAERGIIATRERNWHDLFNALVWLRHPQLKLALNARQVADIAEVGPKARTRGQCAMTHFDEAGAIVWCADPALIALWDAHDWAACSCASAPPGARASRSPCSDMRCSNVSSPAARRCRRPRRSPCMFAPTLSRCVALKVRSSRTGRKPKP